MSRVDFPFAIFSDSIFKCAYFFSRSRECGRGAILLCASQLEKALSQVLLTRRVLRSLSRVRALVFVSRGETFSVLAKGVSSDVLARAGPSGSAAADSGMWTCDQGNSGRKASGWRQRMSTVA